MEFLIVAVVTIVFVYFWERGPHPDSLAAKTLRDIDR